MSSDDIAVRVRDVSKHYVLFERPEDRLEADGGPAPRAHGRAHSQALLPRLRGSSPMSRFEVKRGETVGIIGRNGSGKSTLLQIICGTLQPTRGTVEVNGRIAALLELGAGFNPDFTGRENVYLNAAILGLARSEIERRFDDIARFADIGAFIDQPVKTYSSGMYVRLAFATPSTSTPTSWSSTRRWPSATKRSSGSATRASRKSRSAAARSCLVSHGAQTIVQLCTRAMLFDRWRAPARGPAENRRRPVSTPRQCEIPRRQRNSRDHCRHVPSYGEGITRDHGNASTSSHQRLSMVMRRRGRQLQSLTDSWL